jgi:hypothetical protein
MSPVGQVLISNTAPEGSGDPETSQAGTTNGQNGCAVYPPETAIAGNGIVRLFPGAQRVQLIGSGISQCDPENITNQYQVTLSLSENGHPQSIVLSPVPANCQNEETEFIAPATAQYLFSSRQRFVCSCSVAPDTFSPSCIITATGRGESEVVIVNPRAVNSMFTGATASPTAGGSRATLRVIVLA